MLAARMAAPKDGCNLVVMLLYKTVVEAGWTVANLPVLRVFFFFFFLIFCFKPSSRDALMTKVGGGVSWVHVPSSTIPSTQHLHCWPCGLKFTQEAWVEPQPSTSPSRAAASPWARFHTQNRSLCLVFSLGWWW